MPLAFSTWRTRSAGTLVQFETDGCEIPIRRASSVTPPTARIASWSPRSAMVHVVLLIPARAAAPPSNVNGFLAEEGYRRAKAVVNSLGLWRRKKPNGIRPCTSPKRDRKHGAWRGEIGNEKTIRSVLGLSFCSLSHFAALRHDRCRAQARPSSALTQVAPPATPWRSQAEIFFRSPTRPSFGPPALPRVGPQ